MCVVVFIEEQPVVEIDANGVKVTYLSGGEEFACRVSRAWYRKYIETSLRALNDFEGGMRDSVVQFREHG